MAAPVTSDDIQIISGSMNACEVSAALLQSAKDLRATVDYLYKNDGTPELIHAREIGAILFPPGVTLDFAMNAVGLEGESGIRFQIETIWFTPDEITKYRAARGNVRPFWTVADNFQSLGAPDMAGRFKLSYDSRTGSSSVSGVDGLGTKGGAKEVTLDLTQIPAHDHAPDTMSKFLSAKNNQNTAREFDSNSASEDELNLKVSAEIKSVGDGKPHANMPPYYTVVVAWRTDRMV